ncbi:hypothetical protein C8J57DRAFT_1236211 [Mycena rebaudengoi]|nr:hypothetical protein C8J57DRAFT_1236211 [Mycena rebaudengoi]
MCRDLGNMTFGNTVWGCVTVPTTGWERRDTWWLLCNINMDLDSKGSIKLSPAEYLMGFAETPKSIRHGSPKDGKCNHCIYNTACKYLCTCLGFEPTHKGTHEDIVSCFIWHLVDHTWPSVLLIC